MTGSTARFLVLLQSAIFRLVIMAVVICIMFLLALGLGYLR
jgi:hypothetical protein